MQSPFLSRRDFLATGVSASALVSQASANQPLVSVDYRKLVSRADLEYTKPASRSEEGMPVGNGRMGSLVWTTPTSLKFQINRVDVYPINSATHSFPIRHTDYGSGCGYVDIDAVDFGEDVFSGAAFRQYLDVYDALMTAKGNGVTARVLAWHRNDVMAVEIDDRRARPQAINIDLRMLRSVAQYHEGQNWELAKNHTVLIQTANHTAASQLHIRDGRIALTQVFREGDHYNASAVAIAVVGRKSTARYANESTVRLSAAPGTSPFTILIASAATFDSSQDVAALALKELDAAAEKSFQALLADNQTWWHDFWSKGFVHLTSPDGVADFVEQHYTYFLYAMGSTSRGAFPPRFGGMLWFTNGDMRAWGSQHWWNNTAHYYYGLMPANRLELMDPMFAMYSRMYDSVATAARQQWGSRGIWIPETCWFDGLAKMPDDLADEMRDLYLLRKPWEERSERFRQAANTGHPHNSRWSFIDKGKWIDGQWVWKDKGLGPFGHVSHMMSTASKIAFLYWVRYDCTRDTKWLRDRAYPMLRGAVEFYRNFPNFSKGPDNKYHIHHVNNSESNWNSSDAQEDIASIHGITPLLIRASEILGLDANLRPAWRELLANITPLATNETTETRKPGDPLIWMTAVNPARSNDRPRPGVFPTNHYDLCTLETTDTDLVKIANATYDAGPARHLNEQTHIGVLSSISSSAANLGRADHIRVILPNQIRVLTPKGDYVDLPGSGHDGVLANRLTLREGPGATDCQRLGEMSAGLHLALLQSSPAVPGGEPILRLFGAWPKQWDAQFTLLARGAFLVTSAMRSGTVEFVELVSQAGVGCRLRNPWAGGAVSVFRNGSKAEDLEGSLLVFATAKGESIIVLPRGASPEKLRRTVAPQRAAAPEWKRSSL